MIDFGMDVLAILAPFWDPSWGHVGDFFGSRGGGARKMLFTLFFVALAFFSDLFAVLTPSWRHCGSLLAPLDPILAPFWRCLVPFWLHVGAKFLKDAHWARPHASMHFSKKLPRLTCNYVL